MIFPCELIVKKILPAFRAYIVTNLNDKYEVRQGLIGKYMGITQPAVSQYLSGQRGVFKDVFKLIEDPTFTDSLDVLVNKLAHEQLTKIELKQDICRICIALKKRLAFCKMHNLLENDLNIDKPCGLCHHNFRIIVAVELKKLYRNYKHP